MDVVSGETGKARAMAELAERLEIPLLPVSVRRRWNERFAHAKTGRRCLRPGQRTGEGAAAADLVIPAADSGGMATAFLHGARWIHETMQHT